MSDYTLTKTRIQAGTWEGIIAAAAPGSPEPQIEATHLGASLSGVTVAGGRDADRWSLRIPIPAELLCDGVQVVVISDAASGRKLGSFTIVTGEPLTDDIRAEVELLRAELDMLKSAFRRHCLETA